MSKSIRLLICDDHAVVRRGLRSLVGVKPEMELVGEAVDGEEAVVMAKKLKPDVIIMDLIMPRKDGVTAINEIKKKNSDAKILVLTSFSEDDQAFPAIKAGAMGYIIKDSLPEELLLEHGGEPVSRETILDRVWGYGHDGYEHTVNSHINRLRAKIESDPAHPEFIVTMWGVGYKMSALLDRERCA